MKERLSITEIIDMLVRRWWLLAIASIALAVVAFTYSEFFVDPLYQSDGTLYVNAQRTQSIDISQSNIIASQELVNTYKEILSGRTFLAEVSRGIDYRYSVANLEKMISMSSVNETEILKITVTGKIPEDVYQICEIVLANASKTLNSVVSGGQTKILDHSQIPNAPVSPDVKKITIIAFLAGLVVGAFIILLLELFDTRIKSREDIIERYEEPLLGEIPQLHYEGMVKEE